ncbi:MAG: hypothetical protein LBD04_02885 [Synergistaceae bacterium]|jgi:hypothetical protein|nr:hypothetical protein [Synergistaceae bacterium]
MRLRSTVKWALVVLLLLLFAALVVATAREAVVASNVSNTAAFHELSGIQGADTTQNVAQQKKVMDAGKEAEAKELAEIRQKKVGHFRVISAAQEAQNNYYKANTEGGDISARRAELEQRIPEARGSLEEVRLLTDREVAILEELGNSEAAISIARSFYKALETTVNTLQVEDLTEQQMEEREKNIRIAGNSAIATAHNMARGFRQNDMNEEEKTTLDKDVVEPGEKAVKGLGSVLTNMPQIIWASFQGLSESYNVATQALKSYQNAQGGLGQMLHDLSYNQGMFSRGNMSAYQKRLDAFSAGVQQFLGTYSPFVKTVGQSIGRQANLDAMGYGENVVIRFADAYSRLYVVSENDHMRVLVDKTRTQWGDGDHEVRTMIIYEYDDEGVEDAVEDIEQFAPGFSRYIRDSRIVYIYRGYRPSVWKAFLYEINFQDANGQERYHYSDPTIPKGDFIRRHSWDSEVLEKIAVLTPPKDPSVFRGRFGDRVVPKKGGENTATPAGDKKPKKETPKPGAKPSKVSKKGSIQPPTEGVELFNGFDLDEAQKSALVEEHNKGVENYNAGKYAIAARQFGRAASMHKENHLDAYWAALAAHNAKNKAGAKEWLDRCVGIKGDYLPALEMKKALGLK